MASASAIAALSIGFEIPLARSAVAPPARALSDVEAAETIGGVSATLSTPGPRAVPQDNMLFSYNVTNNIFFLNSITLQLMASGTKTATVTALPTPPPTYTGKWEPRVRWPYPGNRTADLQAFNPNDGIWYTSHSNGSHRVSFATQIHELQFWNLRDDSGLQTNVPAGTLFGIVDPTFPAKNPANPNDSSYTLGSNSIDAYYDQCTDLQQKQYRYYSTNLMTLTGINYCVNMTGCNTTKQNECVKKIHAKILQNDPQLLRTHVVFMQNHDCLPAVQGWWAAGPACGSPPCFKYDSPDPNKQAYWIMMKESLFSDPWFAAVTLAHEIGHTWVQPASVGCFHWGDPGCLLPFTCNDPFQLNNNIHCASNAGLTLKAEQCSWFYQLTSAGLPFLAKNRNQ